jgi:hypothetical protein
MGSLSITERAVVVKIMNLIMIAYRCPLATIVTFSNDKKNKSGRKSQAEMQTADAPIKLLPRNAIV